MLVTLVTTQSNKRSSDVDAISPFYGLVYPESKISCIMQTIPTAKKFKSQLKVLRTRTHQVIQECLIAVPQVAE